MQSLFFNIVLMLLGLSLISLLILTLLVKNEFKTNHKTIPAGITANSKRGYVTNQIERELRRLKTQLLFTAGLLIILIAVGLFMWQ